ncbi:hypothetical protein PNEG_03071 [Pneumocystis murina B123]|uniref:FYVE-type domain-containing protein n=1 Tax=Pneumocystis murina (strain B123) TaxID=1069680 RepID=M7P406_PNEMU|nr:hypothetical protein PNEG_03071 [Pneumocystis murina B123]EMR08595.1 hypothetical protein PNEG_03071 [Pneumocystis murina B123]
MIRSKYQGVLYCPVCNKLSKDLYELNVHLDENHFDVTEKQKETVKSWFKKKVDEAKQLASIVVTQHYLHKEEFELNENQVETEVTKEHWQIEENVSCFFESCCKSLISKGERINCRKCGKLFCNAHTTYQIKLSQDAQHDPYHGVWSRVCKYCYEERKGYMDTNGPVIDYFSEFKHFRTQAVDKINLHANRLEKRISKLFELVLDSKNVPVTNSFYKLINSFKSRKKALEQTIVSWEDDFSVTHCPICKHSFNYTNKKHHCRLCGKIICANLKTECSSMVQLNMKSRCLNTFNSEIVHKNSTNASIYSDLSIRICKNCRRIVFSRKEFSDSLSKPHQLDIFYKELSTLRYKIETLLPNFKSQLDELRKAFNANQKRIDEVALIREKILDTFFQYDKLSKNISQLTTKSLAIKNLQIEIHSEAKRFLQKHMLSLQFVPNLKKKGNNNTNKMMHFPKLNEKKYLELHILEEQRHQVQNWIKDASKRRKYDEVGVLLDNMNMLSLEIEKIRAQVHEFSPSFEHKTYS